MKSLTFPACLISLCLSWTGLAQTPPAESEKAQLFREALQTHAPRFPEVKVNTDAATIGFVEVSFANTHFKHGDTLVTGFRFTAPETCGNLTWSFLSPPELGHWFILPAKGPRDNATFAYYEQYKTPFRFPTAKELGRVYTFQTIPGSLLTPGREYVIWMSSAAPTKIPSLFLSLNIFPHRTRMSYHALFPQVLLPNTQRFVEMR